MTVISTYQVITDYQYGSTVVAGGTAELTMDFETFSTGYAVGFVLSQGGIMNVDIGGANETTVLSGGLLNVTP